MARSMSYISAQVTGNEFVSPSLLIKLRNLGKGRRKTQLRGQFRIEAAIPLVDSVRYSYEWIKSESLTDPSFFTDAYCCIQSYY